MAFTQPIPSPENNSAANLFSVPLVAEYYESTTNGMMVKTEVLRELDTLRTAGINADLADIKPTHELPAYIQDEVDRQSMALGELSKQQARETLFDPTVHSAGHAWEQVSKRAIALEALKNAGDPLPHNIAPGIDPSVYREPLFNRKTAHELMRRDHPRSAERVIQRYDIVTTTSIEDVPFNGGTSDSKYLTFTQRHGFEPLSSADFLTGVIDSRAVDTRAKAAWDIAIDHITANPENFTGRPLVTASLACGAAGPVFEMNQLLEQRGIQVGKNILVDNDPMALASAIGLSRSYGMSEKIDAKLEDLVKRELTDFIEPHSVDVVDILGIVDYLPTNLRGYKAAANFIGKISNIVRPGGIIVAGNALLSRPHQKFFENVWPELQQRNILEMIDIIEDAGYDIGKTVVRVPQREGVYGVYGIPVTHEDATRRFKEARSQRAARHILTFLSNFNKY